MSDKQAFPSHQKFDVKLKKSNGKIVSDRVPAGDHGSYAINEYGECAVTSLGKKNHVELVSCDPA